MFQSSLVFVGNYTLLISAGLVSLVVGFFIWFFLGRKEYKRALASVGMGVGFLIVETLVVGYHRDQARLATADDSAAVTEEPSGGGGLGDGTSGVALNLATCTSEKQKLQTSLNALGTQVVELNTKITSMTADLVEANRVAGVGIIFDTVVEGNLIVLPSTRGCYLLYSTSADLYRAYKPVDGKWVECR